MRYIAFYWTVAHKNIYNHRSRWARKVKEKKYAEVTTWMSDSAYFEHPMITGPAHKINWLIYLTSIFSFSLNWVASQVLFGEANVNQFDHNSGKNDLNWHLWSELKLFAVKYYNYNKINERLHVVCLNETNIHLV